MNDINNCCHYYRRLSLVITYITWKTLCIVSEIVSTVPAALAANPANIILIRNFLNCLFIHIHIIIMTNISHAASLPHFLNECTSVVCLSSFFTLSLGASPLIRYGHGLNKMRYFMGHSNEWMLRYIYTDDLKVYIS